MSIEILILAAVIAIGGGFVAFAILKMQTTSHVDRQARSAQETELSRTLAALNTAQAELTGRLKTLAEAQAAGHSATTKTLEERLEKLNHRVNENLSQGAEKTAETLGKLQTRLTVIDEAQKNITELSGKVVGLQDILANKQARGAFGQIRMEDIVRDALPPSAFEFQSTLSNGRRPDCVIKMPSPPGSIVIDAKFPLEAYQALRAAEDDASRKIAERAFRSSTQKHVTDIEQRYILPGETAESALMFLPSEAVYAELHASFPDIIQASFKARVWIVSPTTLMATLNTVRAVLKDAQMREQADVIQKEVALLVDDVERLQKRVADLRKHFELADGDLKKIETSSDKIVRRTERIEAVQIDSGETESALEAPIERKNGETNGENRVLMARNSSL
jgi:DNA recombination protein RmuC